MELSYWVNTGVFTLWRGMFGVGGGLACLSQSVLLPRCLIGKGMRDLMVRLTSACPFVQDVVCWLSLHI